MNSQAANEVIIETIEECIYAFLKNQQENALLSNSISLNWNESGFPIFEAANDEYFALKRAQERLEVEIRERLAEPILAAMLETHGYEVEFFHPVPMPAFPANRTLGKYLPFNLTIERDGIKAAFRYTEWDYIDREVSIEDSVAKALEHHGAKEAHVLKWEIGKKRRSDTDSIDEPLDEIHLSDFFKDYLSDDLYLLYVEAIKAAVAKANDFLGFKAIPRMSLSHLPKLRQKTLLELEAYANERKCYVPVKNGESDLPYDLDSGSIEVLDEAFFGSKLYRALIGGDDFAKSFWTAEYLYRALDGLNAFDYTPIACGYLKSVEQLAYKLLKATLDNLPAKELWIKSKYGKEKLKNRLVDGGFTTEGFPWPHVVLRKSNEEYFDIALTPLINCLTHNDEAWRSQHAVGKIRFALKRYVSSCRNDHFHKDNINTKRELDAIRSNTKLAIYYLLGGYNPCCSDDEFLALFDTSLTYDEFYSKIRGHAKHTNRFVFESDNGEKQRAVYIEENDIIRIGSSGEIVSEMRFETVESFEGYPRIGVTEPDNPENVLRFTRQSFPRKTWLERADGALVEI